LRILATCQGDYDYLVNAFRAEMAVVTRDWVDHWRREGIYRKDVDADLAATLIGGAYNELTLRMIIADKRPPLEDWLRFALETFFRAFGTPEMVAAVDLRNPRVSQDIHGNRRSPHERAPRGRHT
jgi:hypothetical protein